MSLFLLTQILLSLVALIHFFELMSLSFQMSIHRVWNCGSLTPDYVNHKFIKGLVCKVSQPNLFRWTLSLRTLLVFIGLVWNSTLAWTAVLILSLFLVLIFRGTFNGGSDSLFFIFLWGFWGGSFFSDPVLGQKFTLFWISVFSVTSYFIAGIIKIVKPNWRNGKALKVFISQTIFGSTRKLFGFFILSWLTMSWELGFPFALFFKSSTLIFLTSGIFFHFGVFYFFGLNRFFWTWIATYPSIYYLSLWIQTN